jgi:hypothetical protein
MRFGPRDFAIRDRTPGGPRHQVVDVGVVPHVERTGRAGAWGDEQADGSREHRQNHHAWLHRRDEIRYTRGQPEP